MYIPKHYQITDTAIIHDFIEENAFGELISINNNVPTATRMPFLFNALDNTLTAHIAKQNPHWEILDQVSVLIILNGPHDYISPNWYSVASVPTWNYQTVHITGQCSTFTDPDLLQQTVNQLSEKYEAQFKQPWQPEYNPKMLRGIVGLGIDIESIQCAFKLNQGKSDEDREEVARQLELQGNIALADAMRNTLKNTT